MTTIRSRRWLGPVRVAWRTRAPRRRGDPAGVVRALAHGGGGAVGVRIGRRHILLLRDPELVGQLLVEHAGLTSKGPGVRLTRQMLGNGLLTSEGAPHDRARRLIAPAFSPRRLAGYTTAFAELAAAREDGWPGDATLDIHDEMASLTLEIVGRTLLGIDLADRGPVIRASLESALERFGALGGGSLLGGGPARRIRFGGRSSGARMGGAAGPIEAEVHRIVDEVITERRAHPTDDRGDVVSALLSDGAVRAGMDDAEIHDHVITLIMAGHETTANALTWALFLLGRHGDAQDRLRDEVSRLGTAAPTFDRLTELPFARAVVAEAMRLYPPAWILGRTIVAPLDFDGWQAPAGTLVGVSPLLLHHDPRWFPDAETFDPDRWLDDRRRAVPRHAFLPFGTGPRACIGEQFAWTEAVTVLAVLIARRRIWAEPALSPAPQFRLTMRPAGVVPLRVARG